MTPPRPTLLQTFVAKVATNGGLEKAPKHRREQKVKNSMLGLIIMLLGVGAIVCTGYLALQPSPNTLILGGGITVGGVLLAFGGLAADRETFAPVLKTLIGLGERVKRARHR